MDSYPVYIPDDAAPHRISISVNHIDAKSAIVSDPNPSGDMIVIYYEGNRYGASEIVTLADRARRATERLVAKAATVAMCAVPRAALLQVGVLNPWRGIDLIEDPATVAALARWLELLDDGVDSAELYTRLRISRR
jgi:hypothetical protein